MRAQPTKPTAKKNGAPKPNAKKSTPSKPITKKKKTTQNTGKTKAIAKKLVVQSHLKKKPPKLNPAKKDPDEPKNNDKPADSSKPTTTKSPHSTRSNSPVKKSKNEKKPKPKKVLTSPKKKTKPAAKKNKPVKVVKKRTPSPLKDASVEAKVDNAGDNPNENKAESVSSKSNTKEKKTGKKVATKKAIVPNDAKASTVPVDQTSIISNVDETTTVAIIEDPAVDPVKKSQKSEVEPTSISPPKITIPNLQNINEEDTKTKVNSQHNIPTLKSPKTENERPPKFFTSHRQGKIIDIDQKTNVPKNLKITLAPTEKPTDNKNDELNKNTRSEKGNNEPEIDVYTFTDYKVDSPNSILTEYRNPLGRKIGRVRPIARVKGTIIDKNKLEAERKKVSPHRAPEDIVKQDGTKVSKSNKKPDELKTPMSQDYSNVTSESSTENEVATTSAGCDKPLIKKSEITLEDKTKKIVSKSYKMVSRKSTMFKKKFADVFGGTNSKFSPRRDVKSDDSSSSDKPCSSFVNRKKLKSELKVFKKVKPVGSCAISKKPKMFKKAPKKIVQSHKNKITKKQKFDEDFDHSTFSLNVDNSHETEYPKSAVADKKVQKKDNIEIKPKEIHDHESKSEADDEKSAKDTSDESDSSVRSDEKSYTFNLPSTSKGTKKCISSDDSNPSKRRLKLFSLWTGPKRHRMASLNAIAKVHCLYENESRTHLELGLMKTVERNPPTKTKDVVKKKPAKVEKRELSTSESEYEKRFKGELESSEEESVPPTRNLRNAPGARGSGKYWDHKSSTSSSEDSEVDFIKQISEKKKPTPKAPTAAKVDGEKPAPKAKKIVGAPVKPRRKRDEAVMDLRDMVVKKRMASLNATAILAASYEKRSSKSSKGETTSDSSSDKDETYSNKTKNGSGSGSKEKAGTSDDGSKTPGAKQKVEMIVNQDTDVTITGVYSTHHEGYCTVSGLQYRISSTSHTQTTATTSGDQESTGQEEGGPYTPLGALSSMQPPAEQAPRETLHHPPPVQEPRGLGSLGRRAGGSSAFSAPPPSGHDSGYYQPAGPLIKESGTARPEPDERRALARYHPPHYHHQQMVPQYGGPAYYPAELCYGGRYYRPPAPPAYAPPPAQPEPQMVGVGGEPFAPPPQYYAPPPPCYQHPPQRPLPYLEYQSCPCPMQTCPKNVLIGPAIGNPPTSGGPVTSSESAGAAAGGAFPVKAKARGKGSLCRADDKRKGKTSSGKDPPRGACRPPDHYPPAVAINNPAPSVVPPEALGPPSPARASAGACLPHPPDRIAEPAPDRAAHPAADERVECKREQAAAVAAAGDAALLADLQTDIKKENSEPDAESPSRKCGSVLTEAQTLREHHADNVTPAAPAEPPLKPAKRRRSQPKLEIELDRALLEDARIDGMGDRIKLHKRQKIEQRKPTGTYKDLINASVKPVRLNNGKKQLNVPKVKQGAKSLEAKIETKLEAKAEAKAEAKTETEAEAKVESKTQTKIEAKAETKVEAKTEGKAETKTEAKAEAKEEAKVEAKAEAKVENRKTNKRKNSTPPDASPAKKKRTDENASATESDREPARPRNKSAILLDKLLMKNHVDHVIESVVKNFAIPAEPSPAALFGTPEAVAASPAPENESADVVCKAVKTKKVLNINNNIIDKVEGTAEGATGRRKRSAERARAEPEGERRARSGSLKDSAAAEDGITKDSQCAEREASGEGKYARRAGKARRSAAGKRKSKSRSAERPQADWCVAAAAHAPRWSNGWLWEGEPYTSKVFLNNDESGVRRCWAGMRHVLAGDRVRRGDCVLLRAAARRGSELPFVARVARLWENPNDGEMMVSLVWYYRPEHTERGRVSSDAPDEVFASRHRDANSVACIEDKCYVLTFNEYCRYRKRLKAAEEGIAPPPSIVPAMPSEAVPPGAATNDARLPPAVSPDLVLFCRKVYDFRSKKIQIPNK